MAEEMTIPAPASPCVEFEEPAAIWRSLPPDVLRPLAAALVRVLTTSDTMAAQAEARTFVALVARPLAAGVRAVPWRAVVERQGRGAPRPTAQWAALRGRRLDSLELRGGPAIRHLDVELLRAGITRAAASGATSLRELQGGTYIRMRSYGHGYTLALPTTWHCLRALDVGGAHGVQIDEGLLARADAIMLHNTRSATFVTNGSSRQELAAALAAGVARAAASGFRRLTMADGELSVADATWLKRNARSHWRQLAKHELRQDKLAALLEANHAAVLTAERLPPSDFAVVARDCSAPSAFTFSSALSAGSLELLQKQALVSSLRLRGAEASRSAAAVLSHADFVARCAGSLRTLECALTPDLSLAQLSALASVTGPWAARRMRCRS
eukprot:scaffold11.g4039.t1